MSRFLAGFGIATALWGAAAIGLWVAGVIGPRPEPTIAAAPETVTDEVVATDEGPRGRRNRRPRRAGGGSSYAGNPGGGARVPEGDAFSGDDLGENEARRIDMGASGGEGQLTDRQIEDGISGAMGRIRRCLVLAAGDDPVRGRLVFGLRIQRTGAVGAVNLNGPAVVTTGDAGECLRTAARSIRFPTFDGPDMVVRYPISLE